MKKEEAMSLHRKKPVKPAGKAAKPRVVVETKAEIRAAAVAKNGQDWFCGAWADWPRRRFFKLACIFGMYFF